MQRELSSPVISPMFAVPDASAATDWYKRALGAAELWTLGSVVGLEIGEGWGCIQFFGADPRSECTPPGALPPGSTHSTVFAEFTPSCPATPPARSPFPLRCE